MQYVKTSKTYKIMRFYTSFGGDLRNDNYLKKRKINS
nr:MAG TPA: hypothetical protein [Bacteriophage sp.]